MKDLPSESPNYGHAITFEDIEHYDFRSHTVVLSRRAFSRLIAAVAVEADERGCVLVGVCDLDPAHPVVAGA